MSKEKESRLERETGQPLRPLNVNDEKWQQYLSDRKIFHRRINENQVRQGFEGYYIAVYEGKVVGKDRNVDALIERLCEEYGDNEIYIGECGLGEQRPIIGPQVSPFLGLNK